MKRRGWLAALILAVGLIAVGWLTGQPASVMAKAVRVCLECVGIG